MENSKIRLVLFPVLMYSVPVIELDSLIFNLYVLIFNLISCHLHTTQRKRREQKPMAFWQEPKQSMVKIP